MAKQHFKQSSHTLHIHIHDSIFTRTHSLNEWYILALTRQLLGLLISSELSPIFGLSCMRQKLVTLCYMGETHTPCNQVSLEGRVRREQLSHRYIAIPTSLEFKTYCITCDAQTILF